MLVVWTHPRASFHMHIHANAKDQGPGLTGVEPSEWMAHGDEPDRWTR